MTAALADLAAPPPTDAAPAPTHAPPRSPGRTALQWAVTAAMVVLLGLAAAVVVVPRALGAVPLTVLTGSMEPTLSPGDVVVVAPVATDDVRVGDVLTFQVRSEDPTLVTHRVVAVLSDPDGTTRFVTRGDANGADDDPVVAYQVRGRVAYSVPWIGHVTHGSVGGAVVTTAGVALLAYAAGLVVVHALRHRKDPP